MTLVVMFLLGTSAGLFCTGTNNLGEVSKSTENKELIMMLVDYPEKNLVALTATDCMLLAKACDAYMDTEKIAQSESRTTVVASFTTAFKSMALMFQYEFHILPTDQENVHHEITEGIS